MKQKTRKLSEIKMMGSQVMLKIIIGKSVVEEIVIHFMRYYLVNYGSHDHSDSTEKYKGAKSCSRALVERKTWPHLIGDRCEPIRNWQRCKRIFPSSISLVTYRMRVVMIVSVIAIVMSTGCSTTNCWFVKWSLDADRRRRETGSSAGCWSSKHFWKCSGLADYLSLKPARCFI